MLLTLCSLLGTDILMMNCPIAVCSAGLTLLMRCKNGITIVQCQNICRYTSPTLDRTRLNYRLTRFCIQICKDRNDRYDILSVYFFLRLRLEHYQEKYAHFLPGIIHRSSRKMIIRGQISGVTLFCYAKYM